MTMPAEGRLTPAAGVVPRLIAQVHDHSHQAFKNLAPAADLIVDRDAPVIIGEQQNTEPHESSGSS